MMTLLNGIPDWIEDDWLNTPNFAIRRDQEPAVQPPIPAPETIHNPPPTETDGAN